MAELTPKTINELPTASSLSDGDLIPISSGGASKKTLWSTIKGYFVRKESYNNDVSIGGTSSQFMKIWQTISGATKGLLASDNYIGAWDDDNNTWLWRTPQFPAGSLSSWPVSMGGTGATTPNGARVALSVPMMATAGAIPANSTRTLTVSTAYGLSFLLYVTPTAAAQRALLFFISGYATASRSTVVALGSGTGLTINASADAATFALTNSTSSAMNIKALALDSDITDFTIG